MGGEEFIKSELSKVQDFQTLESGGQKEVYKAVHEKFGNVAIKLIYDVKNFERTVREIEIVNEYDFSQVPSIYKFDLVEYNQQQIIYIIEEFIEGQTLAKKLKQGPIGEQEAIRFLLELLEICLELEAQNIVHRDIKPQNILIDTEGNLWLLDFGIARHLDMNSITPTDAYYGPHTLGYAAPEQIDNLKKKIDIRADLFSIGVLFYEMISGENPFKDNAYNRLDVIRKTKNKRPDKLNFSNNNEELAELIDIMMEKYPSRRPESASETIQWLKDIIN